MLDEIKNSCEVCAQIAPRQLLFQVGSISEEEIVFNREVIMDLFKLYKASVLHVFDVGTRFSVATFLLEGEDANQVWNAFLRCWVLLYTGMPDIVHVDHGPTFTSNIWKKLSDESVVNLKFSGVQHHNGLTLCER